MMQRSVAHVEADAALLDHVELLEAVMNHIDYFAKLDSTGDLDLETVQLLGARIFNDLASAYGQLTRGYYQIAAATLRDVMEVVYLWGYFDREPSMITRWRESDDATRREIFSPAKVRKFLDDFDGFKEGKRGRAYKMFCEYAAHATWQGFALMRASGGGQVQMGPFFDAQLMKAVLEEMAQLAAQAGNNFAAFFDKRSDANALAVSLHRYDVTGKWAEKYLGRKHDTDFVQQMASDLAKLRS
ncbi:MAG: hypothetical protein JNL14_18675 [Devosia sp.]|uniref:hypothetical protein n=1 Tax=Devosia sp. TaxID=1871048 RepID=UPI001A5CAFC3|nr:hypothetical protein [Devosia sp.]MBL8599764.1 hypothetical protein [Devosia sp.]